MEGIIACEENFDGPYKVFLDDILSLLKETCIKPFNARGFVIIYPKQRIFDFLFTHILYKHLALAIIYLGTIPHNLLIIHLEVRSRTTLEVLIKVGNFSLDLLRSVEPISFLILQFINGVSGPPLLNGGMEVGRILVPISYPVDYGFLMEGLIFNLPPFPHLGGSFFLLLVDKGCCWGHLA